MADLALKSTPSPLIAAPPWSLGTRIVFRFSFVYWLLYCLPSYGRISIFGSLPGAQLYKDLWPRILPWVAVHVLHLSGPGTTYRPTGSSDTTLHYVHVLCFLMLAAGTTLVWSALDRNRKEYRTCHYWLRLLVRYTLALTLLAYGFNKVFPFQFKYPTFLRLIGTFGDFSPMGVLWSFMGSSPAYTIFAGIAEVLGGVLLLFRRTTPLGAIISAATLLNVVVINFCYDVPVKLYSSHLFLMAVFLMAPDGGNLVRFMVLNRPAALSASTCPMFERRWIKIGALSIKIVVVAYFLISSVVGNYRAYQHDVGNPEKPPLYGLYQVESFVRNGNEIPPLTTDATRWRMVAIQTTDVIHVKMMDDSVIRFGTVYDSSAGMVTLSATGKSRFVYTRADSDPVVITGSIGNDSLVITMRRIEPSRFLLVNRGFHWISEEPVDP